MICVHGRANVINYNNNNNTYGRRTLLYPGIILSKIVFFDRKKIPHYSTVVVRVVLQKEKNNVVLGSSRDHTENDPGRSVPCKTMHVMIIFVFCQSIGLLRGSFIADGAGHHHANDSPSAHLGTTSNLHSRVVFEGRRLVQGQNERCQSVFRVGR